MQIQSEQPMWSGKLTEEWLAKQCRQLAYSLSVIHHVATLKPPGLPRLRFFRSGRLANDVIKWLSSSEGDPGSLAFSNFSTQPPSPADAAPEYFINLKKPKTHSKSISRGAPVPFEHLQANRGPVSNESSRQLEFELHQVGDQVLRTPPSPSHCAPDHSPEPTGHLKETNTREYEPQRSIRASKFRFGV